MLLQGGNRTEVNAMDIMKKAQRAKEKKSRVKGQVKKVRQETTERKSIKVQALKIKQKNIKQ